ncbi:MAG: HlyD family efflux transporter periplasmic adaptor subunit [Pseudomonadota bacterium]
MNAPPKPTSPSLSDALARLAQPDLPEGAYLDHLVRLAADLTSAPWVALARVEEGQVSVLRQAGEGALDEAGRAAVDAALVAPEPVSHAQLPWIVHPVPLVGGAGALALKLPPGSGALQALAHERLSFLGRLVWSARRHPEQRALVDLLAHVQGVAARREEALPALADLLAAETEADYAALAWWDGARLADPILSGQSTAAAPRASHLSALKDTMRETAVRALSLADRSFCALPGRNEGWVLHVQEPRRGSPLPAIAAALLAKLALQGPPRAEGKRRLRRLAAVAGLLAAIALVPIPDSAEIPATVSSAQTRAVTAPFAARVLEAPLAAGDAVTSGQTLIARLDTAEFDLDLITARAEFASTALSREAARAERNAAELASLDQEVERLRGRIAYLEERIASAEIFAPIDGVVTFTALTDLQGATIRLGDELVRLADPDQIELDLLIPQDAVARTILEGAGVFRPDFDPSRRLDFTLSSRSPALDPTDPLAGIRARATPTDGADLDELRQGMTGIFAMDRRLTPVGLRVWRTLRDAVLLRIWL